jgi:mono/diheme cytochrome c family protein
MTRALLLLALAACASQPGTSDDPQAARMHLGDRWFEHRSAFLGISPDDAKLRDADLDESAPPQDQFWDEQLAVESASVWRMLCNECHGGRRSIQRAKEIPPPPEGWGSSEGQFFGRARPHREIFQKIFHGGEKPEDPEQQKMPPWGDRLSREQIWALVWFIEHASNDVVLSMPAEKKAN